MTDFRCPLCPNHCKADQPRCERGMRFFMENRRNGNGRPGARSTENPRQRASMERRKIFMGAPDSDALEHLILRCGDRLFHRLRAGKKEDLFSVLSAMEQEELCALLSRLLRDWEGGY